MPEFQLPPAEAAPIALHLRLQNVERKIDDLPDAIAQKLSDQFVSVSKCNHLRSEEKREEPAPFWPKTPQQWIFAAVTLGLMIGGALGLIPAPVVTGQPQPPAITAPR
jgi:hypothetical protein